MTELRLLDRVRAAARRWQAAAAVAVNLALCEIGARIGLPGVDASRVHEFIHRAELGLLALYNLLVGGGISRAAVLAFGAMPYLQAKLYLWLARAAFPRVREVTRETARRTVIVRAGTFGLAVIQSLGFAQFLERIPGAVAAPGVGFVTRTVLLLTGSAMVVGWLGEVITSSAPDDPGVMAAEIETSPELLELPTGLGVAEPQSQNLDLLKHAR